MRRFHLVLAQFVAGWSYAQEAESIAHFSVFTNATQNADVSHPRANLGFEAAWKNTGVQIGFGVYYPNWDEGLYTSGGSAQVTCLARLKGKLWMAAAIEFARLSYDARGEYTIDVQGNSTTYLAVQNFEKQMMTASLTASFRLRSRGRFWFQPFAGVGYRCKNTVIPGGQLIEQQPSSRHPNVKDSRDKLGNYGAGIIRLGVLVGVRFGK